jgi:hypothetical protein
MDFVNEMIVISRLHLSLKTTLTLTPKCLSVTHARGYSSVATEWQQKFIFSKDAPK